MFARSPNNLGYFVANQLKAVVALLPLISVIIFIKWIEGKRERIPRFCTVPFALLVIAISEVLYAVYLSVALTQFQFQVPPEKIVGCIAWALLFVIGSYTAWLFFRLVAAGRANALPSEGLLGFVAVRSALKCRSKQPFTSVVSIAGGIATLWIACHLASTSASGANIPGGFTVAGYLLYYGPLVFLPGVVMVLLGAWLATLHRTTTFIASSSMLLLIVAGFARLEEATGLLFFLAVIFVYKVTRILLQSKDASFPGSRIFPSDSR